MPPGIPRHPLLGKKERGKKRLGERAETTVGWGGGGCGGEVARNLGIMEGGLAGWWSMIIRRAEKTAADRQGKAKWWMLWSKWWWWVVKKRIQGQKGGVNFSAICVLKDGSKDNKGTSLNYGILIFGGGQVRRIFFTTIWLWGGEKVTFSWGDKNGGRSASTIGTDSTWTPAGSKRERGKEWHSVWNSDQQSLGKHWISISIYGIGKQKVHRKEGTWISLI